MGLSDLFGGGQMDSGPAQDALNQYKNIQLPNLQWNTYSPEAMNPTLANASLVQDDPLTKAAQQSALAKMGDLANTGLSAVDQAGFQQAQDIGNQAARSGTEAALQNARARGISGSGSELAMREIASQQGAGRAQQAGLQQAADSARQRALYNNAYLSGLGNYRAQNSNLAAQNAGILNQFNMANTNMQNQANQYNVGNQNQAQLINTQGRNNVAEQGFQNQMGQAGGIAQADQGIQNVNAANQAASNAATGNMMNFGLGAAGLGVAASRPAPNYNYNFSES